MAYIYVALMFILLMVFYVYLKIRNKKQQNLFAYETKKAIRNIAISAVLMALAAILKVYGIMITEQMRISFYAIPLILVGLICGIDYGILACLGADLIYSMFSGFPFNPAYTISILFWGYLGGCLKLLEEKQNKLSVVLVTLGVLITSLLETHINLLSNYVLYGSGVAFMSLIYKYIILIVKVPIITFLVILIYKRVVKKLFKQK